MKLRTPPVLVLAQVPTGSIEEAADWLKKQYYEKEYTATFNYLISHKSINLAFKGASSDLILQGVRSDPNVLGRLQNEEALSPVIPHITGRRTYIISAKRLTGKLYAISQDRAAAFRISSVYVENRKVRTFLLQPRKGLHMTDDQYGCLARMIHDGFLAQEFAGEPFDQDIFDVSEPVLRQGRVLRRYQMSNLDMWSEIRLAHHLTVIIKAIEFLESTGVQPTVRASRPYIVPDLPLFQ